MHTITHNAALSRYEFDENGQIIFAAYQRTGNVLSILHVEAPLSLRGTGAAGRFMQELMEKIRQEKLKVIPLCSYAASWLERHPEYKSLLA